MKKITLPLFISIITLLICSCGGRKSSPALTASDLDSISNVVNILQDSIAATWKIMEDEEQLKLTYLKRVIDEISYTNIYDRATFDSLNNQIESLIKLRYDQESMSNSQLIDDYDILSGEVIGQVVEFAETHPQIEDYPIISELINDIYAFDRNVIYRRVDYDNIAVEYNKYIEANNEAFFNSGKQTSKKSLFQL